MAPLQRYTASFKHEYLDYAVLASQKFYGASGVLVVEPIQSLAGDGAPCVNCPYMS